MNQIFEKQKEERLWDMWLTRYPWMDKENYMSFEEFKTLSLQVKLSQRSAEEIIAESEEIRKKAEGRE